MFCDKVLGKLPSNGNGTKHTYRRWAESSFGRRARGEQGSESRTLRGWPCGWESRTLLAGREERTGLEERGRNGRHYIHLGRLVEEWADADSHCSESRERMGADDCNRLCHRSASSDPTVFPRARVPGRARPGRRNSARFTLSHPT